MNVSRVIRPGCQSGCVRNWYELLRGLNTAFHNFTFNCKRVPVDEILIVNLIDTNFGI